MIRADEIILMHMQDELSKKIYANRISYANGDLNGIDEIIQNTPGGGIMVRFMDRHYDNLYIFGAGILGKEFFKTWSWKYSFRAFIDNDEKKQGENIEGIPIIGLRDILEGDRKTAAVIIVNKFSSQEILQQLQQEKFKSENIFNFAEIQLKLNKAQYFDLETLDKKHRERFVDCGALDGKTSIYMYEWYQGNVDKIWIFEPDKQSLQKCRQNLKEIGQTHYEIIDKAVYSSRTRMFFDDTGNGMAGINPAGNTVVETITLDEAIGDNDPGFIKMDIEGAELEALKGAKGLIQKYKPKLAVCVYHRPEDIEKIPELLLEYNTDYMFYLRHYSMTMNETVLYAL